MERPKMTPFDYAGVECGNGWERLYAPIIQRANTEGVHIMQVKEKFGGLRIYVLAASPEFQRAIEAAEKESYRICEVCGSPGMHINDRGWLRTRCKNHV